MRVLAICRVAAGIDASTLFPAHLPAERAALLRLTEAGQLLEAYAPDGPGAVLIVEVADLTQAHELTAHLPLSAARLIDVELIALTPLSLQPPATA